MPTIQLMKLKMLKLPFEETMLSSFTTCIAASVAALLLPLTLLLWWLLRLRCLEGAARLSLLPFFPISLPLPLVQNSGSPQPCRHREPSACVVCCPHGSIMRFSTMPCVLFDTSFSSCVEFASFFWLQRISLALSSLLLLRALPGP